MQNEVGSLQPIKEIAEKIKAKGLSDQLVFHTDASQAVGKIPVDFQDLGVDMISVAGHKFYGPKGIGCLLMKRTIALKPTNLMSGPAQEKGFRAGTENVPYIAALGVACEEAQAKLDAGERNRLLELREHLKHRIVERVKENNLNINVVDNGPQDPNMRLPNTLSISFMGLSASELLANTRGRLCASVGAACKKGKDHASHVLRAMGIGLEQSRGTLRLSLGRYSSKELIDKAVQALLDASKHCASESQGSQLEETKRLYMEDTYQLNCDATVICRIKNEQMEMYEEDARALELENVEIRASAEPGLGDEVLVLDKTIFHPQGGGQPADRGFIASRDADYEPIAFEVHSVKNGVISASGRCFPVVLHYGRYVKRSEAELLPESIRSLDNGKPVIEDSVDSLQASRFARGHSCRCLVNGVWRRNSARLHSAGHLLDEAMKQIGKELPAGKGHHFPDGPFVEYIGNIPAEEREDVTKQLQIKADELISRKIPTKTEYEKPSCEEDVMRKVYVGSDEQGCPCGGTHVKHTGEIGQIQVTKLKVKKGNTKVSYHIQDLESY